MGKVGRGMHVTFSGCQQQSWGALLASPGDPGAPGPKALVVQPLQADISWWLAISCSNTHGETAPSLAGGSPTEDFTGLHNTRGSSVVLLQPAEDQATPQGCGLAPIGRGGPDIFSPSLRMDGRAALGLHGGVWPGRVCTVARRGPAVSLCVLGAQLKPPVAFACRCGTR